MEPIPASSPTTSTFSLKPIHLIIGVIILVILSSLGTYFVLKSKVQQQPTIPSQSPSPTEMIVDWKTIEYPKEGFSFQYPSDRLFLEFPELCFEHMKGPSLFLSRFHTQKNLDSWTSTDYYKNCNIPGEDGSEFEIAVFPNRQCEEATPPEKSKQITTAGQNATLIYNRGTKG